MTPGPSTLRHQARRLGRAPLPCPAEAAARVTACCVCFRVPLFQIRPSPRTRKEWPGPPGRYLALPQPGALTIPGAGCTAGYLPGALTTPPHAPPRPQLHTAGGVPGDTRLPLPGAPPGATLLLPQTRSDGTGQYPFLSSAPSSPGDLPVCEAGRRGTPSDQTPVEAPPP